jgi:hypothetical protein
MRGYQFKSEGPGEAKRNPVTFTPLNERSERSVQAAAFSRKNRKDKANAGADEGIKDEDDTWFIDESLL